METNRQSIDGGGWINLETAVKFAEASYFDGHNRISVNTDTQWEHETLYRSVGGVYVRHSWGVTSRAVESWQRISVDQAVAWLIQNDYDPTSPAEEAIAAGLEV